MKQPLLILLILLLVTQSQAQAGSSSDASVCEQSITVPAGYSLVYTDEFDGAELDLTRWQHRYLGRYQAGYNRPEAIVQPGDGYLHLVTRYEDKKVYTGMIRTIEQFQYGYFEACIRFQSLQGHHGAFWLQSPFYGRYLDDPARSGAEIDIIEFFGSGRQQHDSEQNLNWNAYDSGRLEARSHELRYRQDFGAELSDDFHTFGLLWTHEEYVFFIDGVETWRTSEGISQTEEYIVLSLITSTWENSRLVVDQLPDTMLVDYVRVYRP